jgi:hypothetical protein
MLDGFLDWYRVSFLRRCTGLTGEQLTERSVPPVGPVPARDRPASDRCRADLFPEAVGR